MVISSFYGDFLRSQQRNNFFQPYLVRFVKGGKMLAVYVKDCDEVSLVLQETLHLLVDKLIFLNLHVRCFSEMLLLGLHWQAIFFRNV